MGEGRPLIGTERREETGESDRKRNLFVIKYGETKKQKQALCHSTYGCKVLSFDRPYYINIEWRGNAEQKSFMNNVRPLTNVTIIFSQLAATKTKVTLLHTGWRQDENWEAARQYFIKAWTGAFQQLETIVNKI